MKLSVIILNYNVCYFLEQCLDSVQKAAKGIDAEIIVVDNASADDSCEMVRSLFPDVILIENQKNWGFPKGNNIGVAKAKGEFICILNPDTVVAEDTFLKVLEYADSKSDCGIVGVRLIDGAGNYLPESKRGTPTPFVAITRILNLHKLSPKFLGKYYANHLGEHQTGKVDILVGAFMIMKKSLYLQCGGFDENCFMYSDDIDLSYTVLKSGYSNYYFPETTVIHYKGESTVRDSQYMKRFREAMAFFYKKHFKASPAFDMLMNAGAWIFSYRKKGVTPAKVKPSSYTLVTGNSELEEVLAKALKADFTRAKIGATPQAGSQVVFDSSQQSYREIIAKMASPKAERVTFRIAHPYRGFLIGSDSSQDRGEVVTFSRLSD